MIPLLDVLYAIKNLIRLVRNRSQEAVLNEVRLK